MSKQYHIRWRKCQKYFYVTHWQKNSWHLWLLYLYTFSLYENASLIIFYAELTQWQIYLRYIYVYLSISPSLPWNSIHSDGLRTFPVHKVSPPDRMLLQLTIVSSIVASCPNLDAQHLWASNHVSFSLKKQVLFFKTMCFFLFEF